MILEYEQDPTPEKLAEIQKALANLESKNEGAGEILLK